MGAGLSRKSEYAIVYRRLHKLQRELAAVGIQTVYKRRQLVCFGDCPHGFNISYGRMNASNGEAFLYPVIYLEHERYNQPSWMGGNTFEKGITKLKELYNVPVGHSQNGAAVGSAGSN